MKQRKNEFLERYKDPRWQKLRLLKMEQVDFECECCGSKDITLNIHHKLYVKGAMPWEYGLGELECLCENCHNEKYRLKNILQNEISKVDTGIMEELLGYCYVINMHENDDLEIELVSYEMAEGISNALHRYRIRNTHADQIIDCAIRNNNKLTWKLLKDLK